ncbi:hypothetical protein [Vallitalea sp.]|jgi:hypothetical protein|uniref:hypothetical protein n=1 Tax=Vallitalea sp. TaxID=1882829 RepID=UPI0025D3904F|nr:hypothetical protein [Vallitalea sp.]MCT4686167.1 hypothetical protein [Vallitalea sp.]
MKWKRLLIIFLFLSIVTGIGNVLTIQAREINREPYKKTFTYKFNGFNQKGDIKKRDGSTEYGKSEQTHIQTDGISLEILDVKNSDDDNYWIVKYKATGYLHAKVYKGQYSGSRSTDLRINSTQLQCDDSNYTDWYQSVSFRGIEHTAHVTKKWDRPMELDITVNLSAYTYDAWSGTTQSVYHNPKYIWNLNYGPCLSNEINRNYMNAKNSNSITVKGRVWDREQDDITVTADLGGVTQSKYIDIPNVAKGTDYDYEFTFPMYQHPTDENKTLKITATDHFGDKHYATYTIYIDRVNPTVTTQDNYVLKGGNNIQVSTNEQSEIFLLKNDVPYNFYKNVQNAVVNGKGIKIGDCTNNATLTVPMINGAYRLFAVDRGKNVSTAYKNVILIDSKTPEIIDITVEGNEIIFRYDNSLSSLIPGRDDFVLPYENIISSSICILSDEDRVDYEFIFDDYEGDKKFTDRFVFSAFDNSMFTNPNGIPDIVGNTATTRNSFHEVGKYSLEYQAQDTPIQSGENNFSNYRKWGNKNNIELLVHRRPFASLTINATLNDNNWIINNVNGSGYDLDHMDMSNKGIVDEMWEWKKVSDSHYISGKLPNTVPAIENNNEITYIIRYKVKDIEGAWSKPKTFILNLSLQFDAKLKTEKGQSLNHVSTGQNLITYDISTICPFPVHLELALFDKNNSKQILKTKRVNFTEQITGTKTGTTISWKDINYFIPKDTKEDWYNFKITAISDDGQQLSKEWKVYLVNNTPPTVNIVSKRPIFIYEGDNVSLDIALDDADNDELSVQIELLMIEPKKSSISIDNYTIKHTTYNTKSFTQKYNNLPLAKYKVMITVDDKNGGIAKTSCDLIVNDLSIKGKVSHTIKWDENRKKFNQSKTSTDDKPRDSNTYWSGERFMLNGETTLINNNSLIKATSVKVEILNQSPAIYCYLNQGKNLNKWNGILWNKDMIHKWGRNTIENLTFRFTVIYSNGHIEVDEVTVKVDDTEDYWRYHRKF